MSKNKILKGAAMMAAVMMALPVVANASSHREAPAISFDPAADNTDVYAWVSPGSHDKMYIIANWNPLEEPAGGPNFHKFSDDVLYSINIQRGNDLNPAITYQFRFDSDTFQPIPPEQKDAAPVGGKEFFIQLAGENQRMKVTQVLREGRRRQRTVLARDLDVAPVNIGPRTQAVTRGNVPYDDAFAKRYVYELDNGIRVFAGPRDDGFYVDLGGVFDLANLRAKGVAQDGVAGFNTHTIAIEIPTRLLTLDGQLPGSTPGNDTTLGVWATSHRRAFTDRLPDGRRFDFGPWVQVSRLGLPLINEVVIGLQDKDFFNASKPKNDVRNFGAYFLNPVLVRDAEAVGIYEALGVDPTPFKFDRTDILDIISLNNGDRDVTAIGDVLKIDIATDSQFPNGRAIPGGAQVDMEQVDVVDTLMTVILAGGQLALGDNVDYNDKPFLGEFPWLALPHRGFDEGHGTPTP